MKCVSFRVYSNSKLYRLVESIRGLLISLKIPSLYCASPRLFSRAVQHRIPHIIYWTCTDILVIQHLIQLSYSTLSSCYTGAPYPVIIQHLIHVSYRTLSSCHTAPYPVVIQEHLIQLLYSTLYTCHTEPYPVFIQLLIQLSYSTVSSCSTAPYPVVIQHLIQLQYSTLSTCHTAPYPRVIQHLIQLSYSTFSTCHSAPLSKCHADWHKTDHPDGRTRRLFGGLVGGGGGYKS